MTQAKLWVLMDAPTVALATPALTRLHNRYRPGCAISITWNTVGTQALVKLVGASVQWLRDQGWGSGVLAVYDEENHSQIFDWFYSADWQKLDDGSRLG